MAQLTADQMLDAAAPPASPPAHSSKPPVDAGVAAGLPEGLWSHVKQAESSNNNNAVSRKGALGASQVMPATGARPGYGLAPMDPKNPDAGAPYLAKMIALSGGDVAKGLARYNAGPNGNTDNPETIAYVNKIVKTWQPSADSLLDAAHPAAREAAGEALSSLSKGPQAPVHGTVANPFQQQQPQQPAQPPVDRTPQLAALPPDQLGSAVQKIATAPNGKGGLNAALNLVGLPSMVPTQLPPGKVTTTTNPAMMGARDVVHGLADSSMGWLQRGANAIAPNSQFAKDVTQGRTDLAATDKAQEDAYNAVPHSLGGKAVRVGTNLAGVAATTPMTGGGMASLATQGAAAGMLQSPDAPLKGAAIGGAMGAGGYALGKAAGAAVKYLPGVLTPKALASSEEAATGIAKAAEATKAPAAADAAAATQQAAQAATHPIAAGAHGIADSLAGKLTPGQSASALSEKLAALDGQSVAKKMQWLTSVKKELPADYAAHDEAIYHSLENPSEALSPKAQQYKQAVIDPIMRKTDLMRERLRSMGVSVGSDVENYVPRKLAETADTAKKAPLFGVDPNMATSTKGFSTSASPLKDRTTMALVDKSTGERLIAVTDPKTGDTQAWKNGKVVASKVDLDGKKATIQGRPFDVADATTRELETHTPLQYRHSALLSAIEANTTVGDALRNAQFLEGLKTSPEFAGQIIRPGKAAPEGFRTVNIPGTRQLDGYQFNPRLAQTIDDYTTASRGELSKRLDGVNRLVTGALFYNPMPHLLNVLTHSFVEKGLVGGAVSLAKEAGRAVTPGLTTTTMDAWRAVTEQNADYVRYLNQGAGLKYAGILTRDFTGQLLKEFAKHPDAPQIARSFGYANPLAYVRAIYGYANRTLWSGSDIILMQSFLEKERAGKAAIEAMREAEKHIPNYRVPDQVAGSRMLALALKDPSVAMFGRYTYGRLASYGNMALDAFGRDGTLKDRAVALDQIAALTFLSTVIYPAMDFAAQKITGNDNASVTRSGPATIPGLLWNVLGGKQDVGQAAQEFFRPAAIPKVAVETLTNRNTFTGQKIFDNTGTAFDYAMSQVAPLGSATRIAEGKQSIPQFLLQQFSIKNPTPEQVEKTRKWAEREARRRGKAAQR